MSIRLIAVLTASRRPLVQMAPAMEEGDARAAAGAAVDGQGGQTTLGVAGGADSSAGIDEASLRFGEKSQGGSSLGWWFISGVHTRSRLGHMGLFV